MPVLSTSNSTLVDIAKRLDPDGTIPMIAEILNETNEVLDDMVWVEGNLPTGHRTTIRTGIPTPTWRRLYGGVQPTRSITAQVTDSCGMLEDYSEVDKAIADLNGNTAAYRLSEDKAKIEGMSQMLARTVFYGNEGVEPAQFTGLAPRYNSRNAAVESSDNVLHAGGSGSTNSSIWLIAWSDETIHGIYPKGSKAGLSNTDKGPVTVENVDGLGGRMEAYRTHYKWDCGLTVRDWRYAARICNIDVTSIVPNPAADAAGNLINHMARAIERMPNQSKGKMAFYCNRRVRETLRLQVQYHQSVRMTMDQVGAKRVTMFDGVPIRRCDALLNTEATVPA